MRAHASPAVARGRHRRALFTFFVIQAFTETSSFPTWCCCCAIPVWVLANGHRLYHLDSYRATTRAADEIGPVLQMATLWSWSVLLALAALRPDLPPVAKMALFWP